MRTHYDDWNAKNHDFGFDEIVWENCPPPKSVEIIKWLKAEKPGIIKKMKQGIEPNYGKLNTEYKSIQSSKK